MKQTLNKVIRRDGGGPTSVTPIRGYPVGRRSSSLTTARYSESGRRAGDGSGACEGDHRKERTLQMPHAALHSSVDADT